MLSDKDLAAALAITHRENNYLRRNGFFAEDELLQIDAAIGPPKCTFCAVAEAPDGSNIFIMVSFPPDDTSACRAEAERVADVCRQQGITVDANDLYRRFCSNSLMEDIVV